MEAVDVVVVILPFLQELPVLLSALPFVLELSVLLKANGTLQTWSFVVWTPAGRPLGRQAIYPTQGVALPLIFFFCKNRGADPRPNTSFFGVFVSPNRQHEHTVPSGEVTNEESNHTVNVPEVRRKQFSEKNVCHSEASQE